MVKCLICGVEKECSIVEHLKFNHGLKTHEYKKMFEGSKVKSDYVLQKMSDNAKKNWSNDEYVKKQIKIRNITHKNPEFRQKMSETIKKKHRENPELFSGFTQWSKTEKFKEWVVSKERLDKISETRKKRWENDEYREKTIKSITKSLNDGRCEKTKEFRENMSKIISKLYSEGTISNESNKYKTGKYESKVGETFLYSSSYELDSMILFDESPNVKSWTNKHGIRIKYFYNNLNRHYVPDFLIDFLNGETYIIEMKGWNTEEVNVKEYYTKKIYPNYRIFYSVYELKQFLHENN
jgi:hypothetical protein